MSTEVKLPDLGEGIDSAEVVNVLIEPGQSVQNEQDILEIETDKATVTVPSSAAGEVEEILVEPGQSVEVGQVLLRLKSTDGEGSDSDEPAEEADADESEKKPQPQPQETSAGKTDASDEEPPEEPDRSSNAEQADGDRQGQASDVTLPELGEGVEGGQVVSVKVGPGDTVQAEQTLLEIETDKATVDVPSPRAGTVADVRVSEGDTLSVGEVILSLESSGSGESSGESPAESDEESKPSAGEEPPSSESDDSKPQAQTKAKPQAQKSSPGVGAAGSVQPGAEVPAGPAVRKLARQLGVDLRQVEGTGRGGRIQREDLFRAVREHNLSDSMREDNDALHTPADAEASRDDTESDNADAWGDVRREKLPKIRATIAETLAKSASTIPHVTHFDDADVTELEAFRQQRKNDLAEEGIKLTLLPFVLKALCDCLRRHPAVNASLDLQAGQIIYREYISLGIAVDSERGLVVPVLRNADEMSLAHLAGSLAELARKVQDNDYTVDDLRGGTFTVSNQGAIGGQYATPIINPPQSGILLLGRARKQPVVTDDDQIVPRLLLPLSFSYDHRLIDGADAGRFVNDLKDLLEHPGKLLLSL